MTPGRIPPRPRERERASRDAPRAQLRASCRRHALFVSADVVLVFPPVAQFDRSFLLISDAPRPMPI